MGFVLVNKLDGITQSLVESESIKNAFPSILFVRRITRKMETSIICAEIWPDLWMMALTVVFLMFAQADAWSCVIAIDSIVHIP